MTKLTTFDDSLSVFLTALTKILSRDVVQSGWILRDATGLLTFISSQTLTPEVSSAATNAVEALVSRYCRSPRCILNAEDPGVETLLSQAQMLCEKVQINLIAADSGDEQSKLSESADFIQIRIIDRRIVGADWMCQPSPAWEPPAPARIVFASLKGGVGRSTALTVVAAALADEGKKILAIDLDLEAPGIGTMLIDEIHKPKYGALDWYVEHGIGSITDEREFLLDMISPSSFGHGNGLVDVVPAVGYTSDEQPANVLAKLARAYLDLPQEDAPPLTFLGQTQLLINRLSSLKKYDAILIDARAGLNESTAAAILGLGADVLLFGVDTPQTFASYRYLLAHLCRFSRNQEDDWLYRLRMVHAKASLDATAQSAFRDRAFEIFSEFLYLDVPLDAMDAEEKNSEADTEEVITLQQFGLDDPTGPHYAWRVLADSNYSEFNPLSNALQLSEDFYLRSYSLLINEVRMLLATSGDVQ
jgi:hypothetical protein